MILTTSAQPLDLLSACWRELKRGTVDRRHPFRFASLASVRDGKPIQRTVVNRKTTLQDAFLIYTDFRSGKCSDFQANDSASLLFYHPQKQLQISCHCTVEIETATQHTLDIWNTFPDYQQKDYNRLQKPGEPLANPLEARNISPEGGYQNFAILRCFPSQMDVLQLDRDGHLRLQFWQEEPDQWQGQWVAP